MPPGFTLCRAGPSSLVAPLAGRASLRHGPLVIGQPPPSRHKPSRPSRRFISMSDSKPTSTIPTESGRSIAQTKLDPDAQRRRDAVLNEVKRSEESKGVQGEVRLSFTVLEDQGIVKHPHLAYTKAEICQSWNLHPRDVRPLDSNNALSAYLYHGRQNLVATILPRRKEAIVVNLLYIRALLLRDEVLILDSAEGLDSGLHKVYMANLTKHLQDKSSSEEPFSFRVLDSLLLSSALTLEAEMTLLRKTVLDLLADLEKEISRDGLKRLLSVTKDLSGLGERVGLVNDAVERCLVDDDIIALMDLSHPPVDRSSKGGLEDIELLLESFSQRVEEVISEVQTTTANVNSTQEIVELMLNTSRNALLVLDLKVSLLSIGLASGTLVAGVFGMNLLSGYEETPHMFYYATGALLMLSAVVTSLGLRKLAILRRVGLGVSRQGRGGNRGVDMGMGGMGGDGNGGKMEVGGWRALWKGVSKEGEKGVL